MYRPGADTPPFRPVPAAPPPPRMMGGTYVSPSIPPLLHPSIHPSAQARVPVMQQYSYPPPVPSPAPAHQPLLPPPGPSGLPFATIRQTLPSMQQPLPMFQRPLPGMHPSGPPTSHMLHPSLPRFQPVPPPPPLHVNYQSSLPSVRPAPIPVPPSFPQVQPPLAFGPPPLPSVQQEPFLPPLPATPPSENPPPPPPASPPPQSPQAYTVNPSGDSLRPESPKVAYNQDNLKLAALLPPEPPKPDDPEMIKNINVLAAFVVKNGPRFESMARARQAGDPKFAFLFESDGAPEAAIGHEYYKWRKQNIAVELGLEIENKKVDLGTGFGRSFHEKDLPSVSNERLASPAISDMDMEDDFALSPTEGQLGPGTSDAKGHADSNTSIGRDLSPKQGGVPVTGITGSMPTSHDQAPLPEASPKKGPGARTSWDNAGEARIPLPVGPIDSTTEWEPTQHVLGMKSEDGETPQGRRMGRPTRWENVSSSPHSIQSVAENKPAEMDNGQIDKGNLSSRHGDSFVGLVKTKEGGKEEKPEDGTLTATLSVQPNEEAASVDEFGRLVRKDSVASDSEEDQRPRKRRRSHSRSRSRSDSRGRSRGRGRSRSRSRSRGRGRSRSSSHSSGESRWRRNRSPLRRARWSRSRSRSPNWQRNYSRSPQRRGDRGWRDERESYGRGRRMGRGSGPSLCFHYARGRCFRGNACKFLHPERENAQDRGLHARDVPMDRPEPTASQEMEPSWQGASDLHPVDGNKKDVVAQRMGSTNGRDFSNDGVQHPVGIDQTEEIEHYKDAHGVSPVDVAQVASTEGLNLEQQRVHIDKSADGQGVEAATDLSGEEKLCLDGKVQPDGQSKSEEVLSEGLKVSENVGEDMGSVQNTTMSLSGDLAVRMSDVGVDDDGIKGPKSPLLSRAPPPPGLASSAIPLSAANVTVGLLPNQYMLVEPRHPTAFDSSSPFSAGVAQPNAARPPSHGASTSPNMGFSVGSFNPPHLASRPPFPISSKGHSSIPSASMHGTQPYHHNIRPLSQSSHLSPISSELDPTPDTVLAPRGHHPLLREQPGFTISYALSKEESSRMFVGDNARQYIHSEPSSDGLKHDYFRSSTITSGGSGQSSVPWKDNSLVVSSSTEQASYSYTLTTIPPLSNLIKLPSSSVLAGKADQYDPLSGGLELNLPDPFKASSGKSPGDGRPLGATFLENVSPGVDPLAHTSELDVANMNEAAADVGVVENVSPPGEWSPAPPGDAVGVGSDQLQAKSKRSSRGLKLLRSAVADRVKVLLKPSWKEGRLSKEAFKTIAKKAVEKVTGNLPSHHIPKSQEKVDQFMAMSSSKISKLVQGYVDKYSSRPNG